MPKLLLIIFALIVASPVTAQPAAPCGPATEVAARSASPSARKAWFRCAVDQILTGSIPPDTGRSVSPPPAAR